MLNGRFEEIKELNKFNFSKQSKKFVQAPDCAENFCIEEGAENIREAKDFERIFFADFETFTVDSKNAF